MKKRNAELLLGLAAIMAEAGDYGHTINSGNTISSYKPSRNRTKAQNKRRAKGLRGRKASKQNKK